MTNSMGLSLGDRVRWLLAYALPTVVIGLICLAWALYCFVLPIGVVDMLWVMGDVPDNAVCTPCEPAPDSRYERLTCHYDRPFCRYTIVEFREPGSPDGKVRHEKQAWGDLRWSPIVAATLVGGGLLGAMWLLWLRLLYRRGATRK